MDVRLNNVSQLAGFAKSADLAYFLGSICGATYEHDLRLAPTPALLDAYRNKEIDWDDYEAAFKNLMLERDVPAILDKQAFNTKTVLLCSEATPEKCHRRVVAELMQASWSMAVEHL